MHRVTPCIQGRHSFSTPRCQQHPACWCQQRLHSCCSRPQKPLIFRYTANQVWKQGRNQRAVEPVSAQGSGRSGWPFFSTRPATPTHQTEGFETFSLFLL